VNLPRREFLDEKADGVEDAPEPASHLIPCTVEAAALPLYGNAFVRAREGDRVRPGGCGEAEGNEVLHQGNVGLRVYSPGDRVDSWFEQ